MGCETAQAFSRLGAAVRMVHMDDYLLPAGDREGGNMVEAAFKAEGIEVYNGRKLAGVAMEEGEVVVTPDCGERLRRRRLLVATTGRRAHFDELDLAAAGVAFTSKRVTVNRYLQTTQPHIYAPGDCNGHFLLSHAAMHQGMLALINCMLPKPLRRDFRKYAVPWTVFYRAAGVGGRNNPS
ncbi:MAG TPA: FAD-dependent oxidoreductase [Acidobacteriota bacterium]|nr:FAD-dependent oxidoreductase [Acidobacteriota bacterium]